MLLHHGLGKGLQGGDAGLQLREATRCALHDGLEVHIPEGLSQGQGTGGEAEVVVEATQPLEGAEAAVGPGQGGAQLSQGPGHSLQEAAVRIDEDAVHVQGQEPPAGSGRWGRQGRSQQPCHAGHVGFAAYAEAGGIRARQAAHLHPGGLQQG